MPTIGQTVIVATHIALNQLSNYKIGLPVRSIISGSLDLDLSLDGEEFGELERSKAERF